MQKSPLITPSRSASRGITDRAAIYSVLDAALACHVAYQLEGQPYCIPIAFHREDDHLYLHGSIKSHFLLQVASGIPLCITATHFDALVLARSAFHHSINYRSATVFGKGKEIKDNDAKNEHLYRFMERLLPGRWQDVRPPNEGELKATIVVEVAIEQASGKARTGPPSDDAADHALPVWAGLWHTQQGWANAEASPDLSPGIPLPEYLK